MAAETPASSQEKDPTTLHFPNNENSDYSPILPVFSSSHSSRPRKPPTITPRSFTRFFTPKSSLRKGGKIGASRQALRDITASASNRKGRRTPPKDATHTLDSGDEDSTAKRRRKWAPSSPDPTPELSSPLKRICHQSLEIAEDDSDGDATLSDSENGGNSGRRRRSYRQRLTLVKPIAASRYHNELGSSLQREIGGIVRKPGRASSTYHASTSGAWQYETSNFFTRPKDVHICANLSTPGDHSVPFCAASCKSKSV